MDAPPDRPSSEEPAKPSSQVPDVPGAPASDAAPDAPASVAAPEAPAAADAPRSAVSWLGFATAAIGLVLAAVGIAALFMSLDNGVSALEARLASVEHGVRELASRAPPADPKALEEVTRRVAKLEATSPASDPALAARIAALEAEVKAMAATLGSVGRRDEEVLAVARDARARADASAAALAELAQKLPAATAAERSQLEALASRVTAVERSEKAAESGDRALRLALAATALNNAVERGDAFAAELAAAKALGADAKLVAALEPFARNGVPSAAALARQFSELAPSLQASGTREGVLARLQLNAEKLIRIRRVDEPAGSDAGAIVARAEAKVSRGDIAGAVSELAQLPPDARAPAEAWIKSAQGRIAAIDASRRLGADALSGLAK
jgi:hypothetical protein